MIRRNIISAAIVLTLSAVALGQTKNFTPVDGANLKAKIESAIIAGKANVPNGRFWVGYQFEVRPGVAIDFEIVDSAGGVYMSMDGTSMMFDPRHETRELGLFLLYDTQRDSFTRAEVYNLRRDHEFSSYPVYWAGHITNEESLNYLKSIVDSPCALRSIDSPNARLSRLHCTTTRASIRCSWKWSDARCRSDALASYLLARQHG
jgi:hypothetical protein